MSNRSVALAAVGELRHPRNQFTLAELGCVRKTFRRIVVEFVPGDAPFRAHLEAAARTAAGTIPVEFRSGDAGDRRSRMQDLRRNAPGPGRPSSPTKVLLVGSGKGGVGKSSISAGVAVTLARLGFTVGLLDADVWGSSIPAVLGVTRRPISGTQIVPPMAHGVKVLSTDSFMPPGGGEVTWRGPMLHRTLEQFIRDVDWGGPDFLVVDLPPGTGDVPLSIAEFLPGSEMLLITTPQPLAVAVASRAAEFAGRLGIRVIGVVENFSWFDGDDGKRYLPFGAGGGEQLADDLGVELLACIPLIEEFRAATDNGLPLDPLGELGAIFAELSLSIVARLPEHATT